MFNSEQLKNWRGERTHDGLARAVYARHKVWIQPAWLKSWEDGDWQPPVDLYATLLVFFGKVDISSQLPLLIDREVAERRGFLRAALPQRGKL